MIPDHNSMPGFSTPGITRRKFIAASAGVAMVAGAPAFGRAGDESSRKRYAIVGVGGRSGMYRNAILKNYAKYSQLVGFCDNNEGRLKLSQRKARAAGVDVPIFDAKEFDRMIRETKPHVVIVTSKDSTHDTYIIRAMELGCDVITEKPMTTDEKKCRAILETQTKTGRNLIVAFNYRYSPPRTQIKELLMSGIIGDILSVDFNWLLDTHHGADYFRRWHGQKANSGGLMVHKSTHHFDLVNWWLSASPVSVQAEGKRDFYTPEMAKRLGLKSHHDRCLTCPEAANCAFHLDLAGNRGLKELYLDHEEFDGYFRDQCVFNPRIDIEDTMNVIVKYDTGATLSYSLNAFNAWEGYRIAFNGTKGRIEHAAQERVSINGDGTVPGALKSEGTYTRIYPFRKPAYSVPLWEGTGGHGGGDKVMLDALFLPDKKPDKYLRTSDHRGGAASILTGIAANHAFVTGGTVEVASLVPGLLPPDYPKMPTHADPVPMPPRS
jgi:predicted dehydrogenase